MVVKYPTLVGLVKELSRSDLHCDKPRSHGQGTVVASSGPLVIGREKRGSEEWVLLSYSISLLYRSNLERASTGTETVRVSRLFIVPLDPVFDIIRKRDHANSLPDPKTNPRSNTAIQSLDAVFFVDITERIENSQFCWAISRSCRLL